MQYLLVRYIERLQGSFFKKVYSDTKIEVKVIFNTSRTLIQISMWNVFNHDIWMEGTKHSSGVRAEVRVWENFSSQNFFGAHVEISKENFKKFDESDFQRIEHANSHIDVKSF